MMKSKLIFELPSIDSVIETLTRKEDNYSVKNFSKNLQATLKVFDKILNSGLSINKVDNYLEYLDNVNKNNFSLTEKIVSLADIIISKNLDLKYLEYLDSINSFNFSLAEKIVNNNLGPWYLEYLGNVNKNNLSLAEKIINNNLGYWYLKYLDSINSYNLSLAEKIVLNDLNPKYFEYLDNVNKNNLSLAEKIVDENFDPDYLKFLSNVNENNFSFVKEVIRVGVPSKFLKCLRKINSNNLSDYKDLLQFAIERGAHKAFYENAYKFDSVDLLKKLVKKEAPEDFYKQAHPFINRFGEKFLNYALKHKDFVNLPLLPQDYADRVKNHLSKKNASKLINLVNLLRKQGVSPDNIVIPSNDKINYLTGLVCDYYKKDGKKIVINNPYRALRYYYCVENEKLKSVLEEILADNYNPKNVYSFNKEYFLEPDESNVRREINSLESLLNSAVESVKVIIPDYSFEINSGSIDYLKEQAKRIKKGFNTIFRKKGFKRENFLGEKLEAFENAKNKLSRIINYSPKTKQGRITIKLDSKDKVSQARLLEEISSCFHLTEGGQRNYSQKYLTTDEINFVGIYDERGSPLARFTLGIDAVNKRVGILSGIYKKCNNDFVFYVRDWINCFAKENYYEVGGAIELPIKDFYDDAGKTDKGIIKSIDLKRLNEIMEC